MTPEIQKLIWNGRELSAGWAYKMGVSEAGDNITNLADALEVAVKTLSNVVLQSVSMGSPNNFNAKICKEALAEIQKIADEEVNDTRDTKAD